MNTATHLDIAADRFGRKIAARLNEGEAALPYVVTERLRASREQALSVRKRCAATMAQPAQLEAAHAIQIGADGSATMGTGPASGWMPQWLRQALTALPIAAMVAGIAFISMQEDTSTTVEVAEMDTALLTDALPPDAYTDPGFIEFLQNNSSTPAH